METYFKRIEEGFITLIGIGEDDDAITQKEYENILAVINNRPTADPGFIYKLRTDLTWELCEVPPIEEDEEATEEDFISALAELGVSVNEEV